MVPKTIPDPFCGKNLELIAKSGSVNGLLITGSEGRCLLLLLRISSAHLEILGFLISAVLVSTGIFLRDLKLCRESTTYQVLLVSKKLQFGKERHTLLCILKLFTNIAD